MNFDSKLFVNLWNHSQNDIAQNPYVTLFDLQ